MGQFKELVLSAERDQPLQEHLRKVRCTGRCRCKVWAGFAVSASPFLAGGVCNLGPALLCMHALPYLDC